MTDTRNINLLLLSSFIILFFLVRNGNAQTLHPDSLMKKVESLSNYLLYRNHDTTYIKNYSQKFTFKLIGINKHNFFRIRDKTNDVSARYRPDRRVNLGIGISYKWFAFDFSLLYCKCNRYFRYGIVDLKFC